MSEEGHNGAIVHFDAVEDLLQPISNEKSAISELNIHDALEHRVSDEKLMGHAMEDESSDVAGGAETNATDEGDGQKSSESDTVLWDKTNKEQLQPKAKTLDVDKENTVYPDSSQDHAEIPSSSEQLMSAPLQNVDLAVAYTTKDSLNTSSNPEIEYGPEAQEHKETCANTAEVVPVVVEAETTPTHSPSQAPAVEAIEAHPLVPELETSTTTTVVATSAVVGDNHKAESTTIAPGVGMPVSTVEPTTVEVERANIQLSETPIREQQPRFAEARIPDAPTLETYREAQETDMPVQLLTAMAEPEAQVELRELSMTLVVEQPVSQSEPLVAVDATALAWASTNHGEGPGEVKPSVDVAPETAPSEETKIEDASVNSEVAPHEAEFAVVNSEEFLTGIAGEMLPADSLSVGMDVERPRSPWTPSYSVTTQGPGELRAAQPEEHVPISTKESTPEIDFDHVNAAESVEQLRNLPVTQPYAEVTQDQAVNTQSQQKESADQESQASKSPLLLVVDVSSLGLAGDEVKEDRPKSPWTPSYSVTTQGSAHEPAELDQLPPSVVGSVEQRANGTITAVALAEHLEPVAADPFVDVDHNGNRQLQPSDEPTIDFTAGETSTGAVVTGEEEKHALAGSYSSEDDVPPQAPSQLSVTVPNLDAEEEERPKSPWTPSYSVTSQGSVHDQAEVEDIVELPSSGFKPIDQPDIGEASVSQFSIPEAAAQGDQNVLQGLHDQPVVVPSIDVTETQELPSVRFVHESTGVEQKYDIVAPTQLQSLADELTPRSPLQLVTNMSQDLTEAEDRPKSPWTPSYSVTTQGSAAQDSEDLHQFEQLPPSAVESTIGPAVSTVEDTLLISQAIPFVHEVGPDSQTNLPAPIETITEPASQIKHTLTKSSNAAIDAESVVTQLGLGGLTNVSLVIPDGIVVEDRPASPWTPSYSVTNQGPGMPHAHDSNTRQEDLGHLERLSELASDRVAVPLTATEDVDDASISSHVPEPPRTPQSGLGIFTPGFDTRSEVSAASREPASPTSSRTDLTSVGVDDVGVDDVEETNIPTAIGGSALPAFVSEHDDSTPQPTPLAAVKNVPDASAEERIIQEFTPEQKVKSACEDVVSPGLPQIFPGLPLLTGQATKSIREKPSLLRLTSLDEDGSTDRPLLSFEMPTSATSRKRLESTTSSRFFPGGWFSSSPTIPEGSRTRTSLDVASGEFIRSPSTESRPSGELSASVSASPSSAAAAEEEGKEKKARSCTIM